MDNGFCVLYVCVGGVGGVREPNINLRLNKSCKAICFESGQPRIIRYHWQQVDRTRKEMFIEIAVSSLTRLQQK